MPLAQHDALAWSTPTSPGPPPAVVCSVSTVALTVGESGWKPMAILATSLEDGQTRILRVETPSPARVDTFRQAWIGEVEHLYPGSGEVFPDLGSAQDAAREILREIWLRSTPVPNPPKENRWNSFPGERWNSSTLKTWQNPVPGAGWEALPGNYWDMPGTANWEHPEL